MSKNNSRSQKDHQLSFLKKTPSAYGGQLLKTRKGRSRARPIDTKNSMHLVLRSSKATGEKSFKKSTHAKKIRDILKKFSEKYGIQIISLANVGNHLHFHLKISNRQAYKAFIRAVTGSIAMAVLGIHRWNTTKIKAPSRFWDYRPFTRVIQGFKNYLRITDYIQINQLEGLDIARLQARLMIDWKRPILI